MTDREKFEAYECVRQMGVTNMFNLQVVSELSGLSYDDIKYVMNNYTELAEKYLNDYLERVTSKVKIDK